MTDGWDQRGAGLAGGCRAEGVGTLEEGLESSVCLFLSL
jgi:hypothetical protein